MSQSKSHCLPMKLVTTVKPVERSEIKKKQARFVVCGNFQDKEAHEMLYTANTDNSTIRCALAVAAQNDTWCVSSVDVSTAFLNTPLPEDGDQFYVVPPQILVDFGLIPVNTMWRLRRAVYGLRVSPRSSHSRLEVSSKDTKIQDDSIIG